MQMNRTSNMSFFIGAYSSMEFSKSTDSISELKITVTRKFWRATVAEPNQNVDSFYSMENKKGPRCITGAMCLPS
jgi:hypothetical protein